MKTLNKSVQLKFTNNFKLVKELDETKLKDNKKLIIDRKNIYLSLIYHSNKEWNIKFTNYQYLDTVFITSTIDLENDYKLVISSDLAYKNVYEQIIKYDEPIQVIYNKSLLKSNLQKAIRLSKTNIAVITAFNLIKIDFISFIRRFIIIAIEDVGIPDNLDWLVWLMVSYPNYEINNDIIQYLLLTVISLCEYKEPKVNNEYSLINIEFESFNLLDNLDNKYIISLYIRRCFGGMKCDMELINSYINTIKQNKKINIIPIKLRKLILTRNISLNDIILSSIDHHCFPDMIYSIYNSINRKIDANLIKKLIWIYSSSINLRNNEENSEYLKEWELIKDIVFRYQSNLKNNIKIVNLK
jgi:hypothetical protein